MSITARVLIGLVTGAMTGIAVAVWLPDSAAALADIARPIGRLWLNALQMVVAPLVLALVVLGVSTASNAAASGRTARRAIIIFLVMLSGGAAFTALVTPPVLSLLPRDAALMQAMQHAVAAPVAVAAPASIGDRIAAIVPTNAIAAAAQTAMLPMVVFALFLGFALTRIEVARRERMLEFFQTLSDTMIIIVRWVLWAGPLGVFALVFSVCALVGASLLSALAYYIALLCSVYISIMLLCYLIALLVAREPLRRFAAGILPAQIVAASTQSSLASLPAMVECAQTRLGYSRPVAGLVLPMAVSLFRITSPAQYLGSTLFIAWVFGIEMSAVQLATGCALAVVMSMGAVGLPGQVSFMSTTLPVAQTMGVPIAPLGLLLAVDTIPDVFATISNVTADLTATGIVERRGIAERR